MIVYLFIYLLYNCNLSKYPWHVVCFNIRQSEWLQEAAKYCHSQLPFGLWWWMWLVLLIRSRDVCSASAAFNPYPYSLPFFFAGSRCSMPWWMVRLCFALCSLLFALCLSQPAPQLAPYFLWTLCCKLSPEEQKKGTHFNGKF